MFLRKLRGTEYLYAYYTTSCDIKSRTGFIGHLRCDFGKSGKEFWTTMFPSQWYKKKYPEKFSETLDYVVNSLRGIEKGFDKKNQILKDRTSMQKFIDRRANEEYLLPNSTEKYGARVDCENFTFIINFYPQPGDYNSYVYCYITHLFEAHLKRAEKGIQFVDINYNDLFRIPDGGRIIITEPNGKFHSKKCRFLDDYHFFVTSNANVYHIHQFAEIMEKNGNTVKPQGEVF